MEHLKNRFIFNTIICCILLFFSEFNPISAQTATSEKKWNFLTDVFLMFSYMDGETGIGDLLSVPVDANPGDIFSKLKMAAMLYLEAKIDKWAITSDLVYMNLKQEVTPGTLFHSGEVAAKEFIWEPAGFYRIVPIPVASYPQRDKPIRKLDTPVKKSVIILKYFSSNNPDP